jgi:hypothetical protein
MKKQIFVAVVCMVFLATIPIAAGMQTSSAPEPAGIFDKTYIRGYILGHKTEGRTTTFYAVFCHYTIYKLFHEPEKGVVFLKEITFKGKFNGHMGMFYLAGTFRGTPF